MIMRKGKKTKEETMGRWKKRQRRRLGILNRDSSSNTTKSFELNWLPHEKEDPPT